MVYLLFFVNSLVCDFLLCNVSYFSANISVVHVQWPITSLKWLLKFVTHKLRWRSSLWVNITKDYLKHNVWWLIVYGTTIFTSNFQAYVCKSQQRNIDDYWSAHTEVEYMVKYRKGLLEKWWQRPCNNFSDNIDKYTGSLKCVWHKRILLTYRMNYEMYSELHKRFDLIYYQKAVKNISFCRDQLPKNFSRSQIL